MSKAEILLELPKLNPEERYEIWERVNELDGPFGDDGDDDLTPEEEAMIESRLDYIKKNPDSCVPAEEALRELRAKICK